MAIKAKYGSSSTAPFEQANSLKEILDAVSGEIIVVLLPFVVDISPIAAGLLPLTVV